MSHAKDTAKTKHLQDFLGQFAEKLSRTSGFVQRTSKMTGALFIQILLFGWLENPHASLVDLSYWASKLGLQISPQAIGKRFQESSVDFLRALFAESLVRFGNKVSLGVSLVQAFQAIYLIDSTQVELASSLQAHWHGSGGDASKAALKAHLCLDYRTGSMTALQLTDGGSSDTSYVWNDLQQGALYLFDLGYFQLKTFRALIKAQAFFISRLFSSTKLYLQAQATQALDLPALCATWTGDRGDLEVYMGAQERMAVRLLFQRCPPKVVEARRRRAKANAQHRKRPLSAKQLALLDWSIFVTNVPNSILNFEQVLLFYRLRWQIELLFKLCKSQLHLDQVSGCGEARMLSQLYARLILLVLFLDLSSPLRLSACGELSWTKAFVLFSRSVSYWIECIRHGWRSLSALLANIQQDFLRFAQKTKRKKSPSTLQLVIAAGA